MEDISAIVLAAGKGTRMKTNKSKVVHKIYGKELVKRVVETAYKAGIKTVIIPKDNLPDLDEVDETVKANIEFVLAEHISDVLETALVGGKKSKAFAQIPQSNTEHNPKETRCNC